MLTITKRGVVLTLTLIPAMAAAQTNGFVLQCLSARTSAMGCVTRAQAGRPTSLFRDPAGLTSFARPALEVNLAPFMPSLTFSNGANAQVRDGAFHAYPMGSFAYVGPRPHRRVAWALGMEPVGGFGSDFSLKHALLSGSANTPVAYESFFAAAKFGPSVGIEIAPGFSVGASVSGVYAMISDFRMPFSMPPSIATGLAGIPQLDPPVYGPLFQQFTELTAYGDSKDYAGLTWTGDVGVAYRREGGMAFAASWSPERPIDVDGGSAVIDMSAQFGQMMQAMIAARMQAYGETAAAAQNAVAGQLTSAGVNLAAGMSGTYSAATTITLPMTIGAGLSFPLSSAWTIAAELEWRKWSTADDVMPFRLTDGTNSNINLMLNANPADGRFTYPFQLQWKDALSTKVGTSYRLGGGNAVSAGFLYGQNPVPDNTVFITFPAISTTAVTLGATWEVAGTTLDLSYVHAFSSEITGTSAQHMIGSEYRNSRTTMSQNVLTIGHIWHF